VNKNVLVCGKHFNNNQFINKYRLRLRKDALPGKVPSKYPATNPAKFTPFGTTSGHQPQLRPALGKPLSVPGLLPPMPGQGIHVQSSITNYQSTVSPVIHSIIKYLVCLTSTLFINVDFQCICFQLTKTQPVHAKILKPRILTSVGAAEPLSQLRPAVGEPLSVPVPLAPMPGQGIHVQSPITNYQSTVSPVIHSITKFLVYSTNNTVY